MATSMDDETAYFLRASLLLLKGGRLMSVETLNREVLASGKSLDELLKENEGKLRHKLSKYQTKKLFPDSGGTCVDKWDLAMLVTVLLTVFKRSLNEDEKDSLKCIKYKRDTVYAHTHTSALPFEEYDDIREELETAFYSLSNRLSDNVKDECPKIIQQCTKEPLSSSSNAELMKQLNDTESMVKAVMVKLEGTHAFLVEMKKEIMDKLREMSTHEDKRTKIIKVIYTELSLSGDVNESNEIDFVENIVTTVINAAIEKVGNKDDYPRIRRVVENILREVGNIPGVNVLPAEHKCILLKFECTTADSILAVLTYLDSERFTDSVSELANTLNATLPDVGSSFRIDATIPPECLRELLDELEIMDKLRQISTREDKSTKSIKETEACSSYTRTIQLRTEVQTIPGIQHIWSLFENGGATNSLNQLTEAIYDELHTKITIKPSVNVEQVLEALHEADVQTNKSVEELLEAAEDKDATPSEQLQSKTSEIGNPSEIVSTELQTESKHVAGCLESSVSDTLDKATNALFRTLVLERNVESENKSVKSLADSGVGETSSVISQSKRSDVFSDLLDNDMFVPSPGQEVLIKETSHEWRSTVGPIVKVQGIEERCFITFGGHSDDDIVTVSVSGTDMKVLARNSDGTILVAPHTVLQENIVNKGNVVTKCHETDKLLTCEEILNELYGKFVSKLGAITNVTEGTIAGVGEISVKDSPRKSFRDVFYIGTLPSSNKPFASPGDGGAAVYHKTSEDSLNCIGVLLGTKIEVYGDIFFARPIKDILCEFEENLGIPVSLDYTTMEEQLKSVL